MLKLIIADDERIIRETISNIIDWKSYDIEVIGLCKNGFETYDMIMDENPDIVLTDIRMPGMDGLELIHRISSMNLDVQFIILSGYSEFEYAKQAMKSGIRHYLLKPCNETQIIEAIQQCKQEYFQKKNVRQLKSEHAMMLKSMEHNIIFSIINDSICQKQELSSIMKAYESHLDFTFTPYRLYYVYYLTFENLREFCEELHEHWSAYANSITLHGIYVKNTLLLFFMDFSSSYQSLEQFFSGRNYLNQSVSLEWEGHFCSSLSQLLSIVLPKISRFEMIYYINNFRLLYTCNYNTHISKLESLCQSALMNNKKSFSELAEMISGIEDISFLRQISSNLLIKLALNRPGISSIDLSAWLTEIEGSTNHADLKDFVIHKIQDILNNSQDQSRYISTMTRRICDYVEKNLQDDNLTLKYIAENHLYMNVDYVSKKFQKEMGIRFSAYLADARIRKAKQYLSQENADSIQVIAESVGLGNNPRYFSQLFKKKTGVTPSAYLSRTHGNNNISENTLK